MKAFANPIALILAAAVVSAPFAAAAQSYAVVRPGDNEATCEALIAEINTLTAEVERQQQQAQRSAQTRQTAGRLGRGLLSGLARSAGSLAYGGSLENAGAAVAANAASSVASEIASGGGGAPAPQVEPVNTPQKQRLDHLQGISAVRPC